MPKRWIRILSLLALWLWPLYPVLPQIVTPEVRRVSEAFVCQCGCNHQLSACGMLNCGSATPLRAEIAEKLKEGKTRDQIVADFIEKYGKVILAAPTTQGLDLAAWVLPIMMTLVGLLIVYGFIRVWLQRKSEAPAHAAGPVPSDYQNRVERELKELDS
ncbi:MAG: cytochrome c-type biogenesis protein CcmH [Acidobacteriota bacterium]